MRYPLLSRDFRRDLRGGKKQKTHTLDTTSALSFLFFPFRSFVAREPLPCLPSFPVPHRAPPTASSFFFAEAPPSRPLYSLFFRPSSSTMSSSSTVDGLFSVSPASAPASSFPSSSSPPLHFFGDLLRRYPPLPSPSSPLLFPLSSLQAPPPSPSSRAASLPSFLHRRLILRRRFFHRCRHRGLPFSSPSPSVTPSFSIADLAGPRRDAGLFPSPTPVAAAGSTAFGKFYLARCYSLLRPTFVLNATSIEK